MSKIWSNLEANFALLSLEDITVVPGPNKINFVIYKLTNFSYARKLYHSNLAQNGLIGHLRRIHKSKD